MDKASTTFFESQDLPDFQKMQGQFALSIRNPDITYDVHRSLKSANQIETRRLKIYQELFFNNIYSFFTTLFPILSAILGEVRSKEIVREYLIKHRAKTPLFHELGQEFLLFFQEEFKPLASDPEYILEMAHYEWVELAVSIEPSEGFANDTSLDLKMDWVYEVSPLAWPLAYEWPVQEISAATRVQHKTGKMTTLLVFRDAEDKVQFMALTPLLYALFQKMLDFTNLTFEQIIEKLAEDSQQSKASLMAFAPAILQDLYGKNMIRPIQVI